MEQILIMCRSITQAQRAKRLLEQNGISAALIRAPGSASGEGCAYALKLRAHQMEAAVRLLRPEKLCSGRVLRLLPKGDTEEVLRP